MFATRSARELPTAKIVRPMIASDRPKTRPNVWVLVEFKENCDRGKISYLKHGDNFVRYCHYPHN
jgi:hypothetical protein